uniref:Uncharacterized protein n=1 Tax=Anolis carolinensis TaxID=28377 RepID=A0A803T7R9_ANOCA
MDRLSEGITSRHSHSTRSHREKHPSEKDLELLLARERHLIIRAGIVWKDLEDDVHTLSTTNDPVKIAVYKDGLQDNFSKWKALIAKQQQVLKDINNDEAKARLRALIFDSQRKESGVNAVLEASRSQLQVFQLSGVYFTSPPQNSQVSQGFYPSRPQSTKGSVTHRSNMSSASRHHSHSVQISNQSFPTCTPAIKTFMPALDVGDALGEIETDKAVVTMESNDDGILAEVMTQEGSESMSLGTPTGLLVEEGQDWKQVEIPSHSGEAPSLSGPLATTPVPIPSPSVASLHKAEQHPEKLQFHLSPAAHDSLESYGLDASSCTPSDPREIFSKEDALSLLEQKPKGKLLEGKPVVSSLPSQQVEVPLMPSPDGKPVSAVHSPAPPVSVPGLPPSMRTFSEVPTSNIGRVIAKGLIESKIAVPHACAAAECDLGAVLKLRQELAKERIVSVSGSKIQSVSLKDVPAGLAPGATCELYTSKKAIAAVEHHRVKLEQEAHRGVCCLTGFLSPAYFLLFFSWVECSIGSCFGGGAWDSPVGLDGMDQPGS